MGDVIHVRGEGGARFALALPLHEAIEEQLRKGVLIRVNADGSEPYSGNDDDVAGLPTEMPKVSASKTEWIGWAVAQGCSTDDAEAMTKADLVEKFGSPE